MATMDTNTSIDSSATRETPRNKRSFAETVSPSSSKEDNPGAPKPTRRRNSIGSIKEVSPASKNPDAPMIISHKGKSFDLSQLVHSTITNQNFIDKASPTLLKGIEPGLCSIVSQAVEKAIGAVITRLDEQSKSIETLSTELNKKMAIIDDLNNENKTLKSKVVNLEKQNFKLTEDLDHLEQYGRRNSLRFHNVPVPSASGQTDDILVSLINENLSPDQPITTNDIERSHFIGKPSEGRAQIICKFKSWKTKFAVFKAKKNLKHMRTPGKKIFISEDLTKPRQAVVKKLSDARKAGSVHSYWTNDGRIFFKRAAESSPVLIKSVFSDEFL